MAKMMVKCAAGFTGGEEALLPAYGIVHRDALRTGIATKDAKIEIERARSIAEANAIINSSLTPEYLQRELYQALEAIAANEGGGVVMPANMLGFNMILDTKNLSQKTGN